MEGGGYELTQGWVFLGTIASQIGVSQVEMTPGVAENLCTTIQTDLVKRRHLRASSYFLMLLIDGES
jgi:hypothetical protein